MSTKRTLRMNIFVIGDIDAEISGNKLPSHRQVLKVLFYNLRELKLSLQESATLVIKEVIVFWKKAGLPTQQLCRCVQKLKNLYTTWRALQKGAKKSSNVKKEKDFASKLDNLFDIAHGNVLKMIDEKREEFLLNQRKDGRLGYISQISKDNV